MPISKCILCKNVFYAKPSHLKRGWGTFCSNRCKSSASRKREYINCTNCGILVSRTQSQITHSKSRKFFCNKSCQTKWRNVEYSGKNHTKWIDGSSLYRKIILRSNIEPKCLMCTNKDLRVLAVHHIDKDHANFSLNNLAWLCHNCHYVVHHDKLGKQRFDELLGL